MSIELTMPIELIRRLVNKSTYNANRTVTFNINHAFITTLSNLLKIK